MGHDLHPDPELGHARRLRGSPAHGGMIEEMAPPAWVQQRRMSRIELRCSIPVDAIVSAMESHTFRAGEQPAPFLTSAHYRHARTPAVSNRHVGLLCVVDRGRRALVRTNFEQVEQLPIVG